MQVKFSLVTEKHARAWPPTLGDANSQKEIRQGNRRKRTVRKE